MPDKAKRKNREVSTIKTPVRKYIGNILMFLFAIIALLIFSPFICIGTLHVMDSFFVWSNLLKIQQAVIEQCDIPDYEARGYFDSSSMNVYSDSNFSPGLRISCIPADYPGGDGSWQCRCEEREID